MADVRKFEFESKETNNSSLTIHLINDWNEFQKKGKSYRLYGTRFQYYDTIKHLYPQLNVNDLFIIDGFLSGISVDFPIFCIDYSKNPVQMYYYANSGNENRYKEWYEMKDFNI